MSLISTWFEPVFEVWYQVVLLQHQLPVQVRDGEVGQCSQTLKDPLLLLLSPDLRCQVANVVLTNTFYTVKQVTKATVTESNIESVLIGN